MSLPRIDRNVAALPSRRVQFSTTGAGGVLSGTA